MPEPRKIGFIAASNGAVTRYVPPPPPMTREERYAAYYEGIKRTADHLKELGFRSHHEAAYTVSMEYKSVLFDFRIQIPDNVAHVTSGPRYVPGKGNALVYKLRDEIKSEYCLQLIVSGETTLPPAYIPLDESLADPADFIHKSIIGFLRALSLQRHRLGDAVKSLPEEQKKIPEWIETNAIDV